MDLINNQSNLILLTVGLVGVGLVAYYQRNRTIIAIDQLDENPKSEVLTKMYSQPEIKRSYKYSGRQL